MSLARLDSVAQNLSETLLKSGLTISTAESCTGGLIGSVLTEISGSSRWYVGGVIAYSNDIKKNILGVPQKILDDHGAVSCECVEAMAIGAAKVCGSRLSVAISGIAGPDGGTAGKPVGLVWTAICLDEIVESFKDVFDGDRQTVREDAAIKLLERCLERISRQ